MKFSAFVTVPFAFSRMSKVLQQESLNPCEGKSCIADVHKKSFVHKVSKDGTKLFYNDRIHGDGENYRGRYQRFLPQELYFNFMKNDLRRLKAKYEDGADPQMKMDKEGNTMAHLIMSKNLSSEQPKEYLADHLAVLMQMGKNGYDFNTKNNNGLTPRDVAMLNGNREFAIMSVNIQKLQDDIPDSMSKMTEIMYNLSLQENPSKKGKEMILKLLQRGVNVDEGKPGEKTTIADEVVFNWDEETSKSFFELKDISSSIAYYSSESKVLDKNITDATNDSLEKELFKWRDAVSKFCKDENNERLI